MKTFSRILLAAAMVAGTTQTFAITTPPAKVYSIDIQDRHLSGFSAVAVSGSFDVYITQGATESVKVEADGDEIDKIVTEVKDGVLKVYTKNSGFKWNWSGDKKRIVRVVAKDLKSIGMSGSGDIYFKEGFKTQALTVRTTGSGDIEGKVDVRTLESISSGSGDIKLSGRADVSTIRISGSGDFNGKTLVTASTTVRISGSGDATVYTTQKLNASVSGSGDIHYTGGAKDVSSSTSGSGDLVKF